MRDGEIVFRCKFFNSFSSILAFCCVLYCFLLFLFVCVSLSVKASVRGIQFCLIFLFLFAEWGILDALSSEKYA